MLTVEMLEAEIRRRGTIPACSNSSGGHIQQDPWELARFCRFLLEEEIDSYFEVGLGMGATFQFMTEYVKLKGYGVDRVAPALVPGHPNVFVGDCHHDAAHRWAQSRAPYGLVFIDGDHGMESIIRDLRDYGPMASHFIGFHDVAGRRGCDAAKMVWDAVKAGRRYLEFLGPVEEFRTGIGVVWVQ